MDDWSRIQQSESESMLTQNTCDVFRTFDDVTSLPISIPNPLHASTTSHGRSITVSALVEAMSVCGNCAAGQVSLLGKSLPDSLANH